MANFKIAEKLTAGNEGGFANDPDDAGGMTLNGIAKNFWPAWEGWPRLKTITDRVGFDAAAINAEVRKDLVLLEMISRFYKVNFWDVNCLDQMKSQAIANEMYDTGVNMGTKAAAKMLQEALNMCNKNEQAYADVEIDGKISPAGETMRAVNEKASEFAITNTLNMLQGEKYLNIMRTKRSQEKFWPSWLRRVVVTSKW